VEEAGPSMPVVILGLQGAPNAGDDLLVVESERKAREVALYRQGKFRDVKLARQTTKAEDIFQQIEGAKASAIQLVVKADVQGSVEALRDALTKLSTDEVAVKVISSGVGGITESDVTLAAASRARIIAFNVRADATARNAIKETAVDVRYYSIIYEALDDVKQMVSGMLAPEIKEQIVGLAEVREVFRSSKFGTVAGCMVVDGFVRRNNPIRVLRDNVVIFEGALESLRRFKDDVNEVRAGTECGIGVKNYNDVRAGDQIECYTRVEVARSA
jgi:translation initiation factor IF-2